jgi:PAS domain S-box-containing protein
VPEDHDIRLAEKIASAAAELYHSILESTSTGIIAVEREDLIIYANRAACDMWAYESAELVGNPISLLLPTLARHVPVENTSGGSTGTLAALCGRELDVEGHTRDGTLLRVALSVRATSVGSSTLYTAALQDISDRLEYQQALVAAREQAEEMARVRTALITNIGHEIRTPLTGIQGFSNLLVEESTGPQREFATLIAKNTQRLLETLNSVMELARLEASPTSVAPTMFDVVGVLRDVMYLQAPNIPAPSVQLIAASSHQRIEIHSIQSSLYSILHNLVGNAIKFTRIGTISVGLTATEAGLRIEVEDTGVGISSEFLPRIFDEFSQESTGLTRAFEGSGLGLAIVQRAVRLLDGEIHVESEQGKGTRFVVTLPVSPETSGDPITLRLP